MRANCNCRKFRMVSFLLILMLLIWPFAAAIAAERMAVKTSIANLRTEPEIKKNNIHWKVEKYHPFIVLKKQKDWYRVKDFEGDTAWIHKSVLGKINTVITKIKENTLCNIRSKPDKKSEVLFQAQRGVPFKVLKRKGNWIRVEYADGKTGWIYKTLVW